MAVGMPVGAEPDLAPDDDEPNAEGLVLTDEDFLRYVRDERGRAVGFDSESELTSERTRALNYYKGEMDEWLPPSEGRSKAKSLDVFETVQSILPDIVDILINEDIAAFKPTASEDVEQAQLESDYVQHVVLDENDGFTLLFAYVWNALVAKTGLLTWDWEPIPATDQQQSGLTVVDVGQMLAQAQSAGQPEPAIQSEGKGADGLERFSITAPGIPDGRVVITAIPPEDFTCAEDTVRIADGTYSAWRWRPRVQDLIQRGYDADQVRSLPAYGAARNEGERTARDTAQENSRGVSAGGLDDLKTVEVVIHYLRVDADDDGVPEVWRIVTGADEVELLRKECVGSVNIAAGSAYLQPHRFYAPSVADVVIEGQDIKTTLTRGYLDSVYFGLNQRYEVATGAGDATEFTLSDLMNNVPGWPVRSKSGKAVRALGGAEGFQGLEALEYFSTQVEQRTGAVRMAQGLNPDTLHDTASGALSLMNAAQRRIRMIARVLAETGLKDLFVGVHAMLRANASKPQTKRLGGRWCEGVVPSTWTERSTLTVKIGVGAGGRQYDMSVTNNIIALQEKIIQQQGGVQGPFVTARNISNSLRRVAVLGQTDPDAYFSEPPTDWQPPPPQQDPKLALEMRKLDLQEQQLALETKRLEFLMTQGAQKARLDARAEDFDEAEAAAKLENARDIALINAAATEKTAIDSATIRAQGEGLRVGADLMQTRARQAHDILMAERAGIGAASVQAAEHAHEHVSALRDHVLDLHGAEHADALSGSDGAEPSVPEPGE